MNSIFGIRASRRRVLAAGLLAATASIGSVWPLAGGSPIDHDDKVILFPVFAVEGGTLSWTAHIRGWIYEREEDDTARRSLLSELKTRILQRFALSEADLGQEPADQPSNFSQRAGMFLVDNERRKRIAVTINGSTFNLGRSEPNGHFAGDVRLTGVSDSSGNWTDVHVVMPAGNAPVFAGKMQFIGRRGFSVVSDIDDTIKHSEVRNKIQLGLNTFVRDFRAAPGMAALYQRWEANGPVVFHYVSGSPFQLYPDLAAFAKKAGFPAGSFHLRTFRLKDRSAAAFFGDPLQFKLETIRPLLDQFPDRRFILVGDSGEHDPEVYAQLGANAPNVAAILIRNVTDEDLTSPRLAKLFAPLPARILRRVFRDTKELEDFTPH
jgi:phosphatidate phosphatase APP1